MSYYDYWKPYVSVHQRQKTAQSYAAKLAKEGEPCRPITVVGRKIAHTFWGRSWCENLGKYSDFENRLPRGRRYVCNGSVFDLRISAGKIVALVSGSDIYSISIAIKPAKKKLWEQLKGRCAGQISSLVELLGGKLSDGVMRVMTDPEGGLFPTPDEMEFECSCPDYAYMCKHVAAALYGVGARLDVHPHLLFELRQVDHSELLAQSGRLAVAAESDAPAMTAAALSEVFGIELDVVPPPAEAEVKPKKPAGKKAKVVELEKPAGDKAKMAIVEEPAGKKAQVAKVGKPTGDKAKVILIEKSAGKKAKVIQLEMPAKTPRKKTSAPPPPPAAETAPIQTPPAAKRSANKNNKLAAKSPGVSKRKKA